MADHSETFLVMGDHSVGMASFVRAVGKPRSRPEPAPVEPRGARIYRGEEPEESFASVQVDGKERHLRFAKPFYNLELMGRVRYEDSALPQSQVRNAAAILLCFSVVSAESLNRLRTFWAPLLVRQSESAPVGPVFLVGLQADRRSGAGPVAPPSEWPLVPGSETVAPTPVPTDEIERAANEMHVTAYKEVSAASGEGLNDLIESVAREIVTSGRRPLAALQAGPPTRAVPAFNLGRSPLAGEELKARKMKPKEELPRMKALPAGGKPLK